MAFKGERPPWENDPEERPYWVTLRQAGEIFRKDHRTLRIYAVTGTIKSYFDGFKWWVRLDFCPTKPTSSAISAK